uniref:Uncharacterized protein n=1 Tax=Oryza barthii TaxID=65489 RepID=A0A0D3HEI0_9ORYZ
MGRELFSSSNSHSVDVPLPSQYQFRAFLGARSIMLDDVDDEPFADGISSPIAQHIYDFCDDGNGGDLFAAVNAAAAAGSDMFTASSEDASASSSSTATAPIAGGGDTLSPPLPSLDSTLSALLEQDEPPGADGELLLPIDDYAFAAVDETQPPPPPEHQQQQFTQMPLPVMGSAAAEHPALQAQLSSTATELMQKTLADSRPRVRGRFAKNDDYCEASRSIGSQNHEEYEQIGGVKGEDMLDSDALAHISGMSSYMYNHTVESWI